MSLLSGGGGGEVGGAESGGRGGSAGRVVVPRRSACDNANVNPAIREGRHGRVPVSARWEEKNGE